MKQITTTMLFATAALLLLVPLIWTAAGVQAAATLSGTLQLELSNSSDLALLSTSSALSPRRAVLTLVFRLSREVDGNSPTVTQVSLPSTAHSTAAGFAPLVSTASTNPALLQSFDATTRILTAKVVFSMQHASATERNALDSLISAADVLSFSIANPGTNTKIAAVLGVSLHFEELLFVSLSDTPVSYATAAAQCSTASLPPSSSSSSLLTSSTAPFLATSLKAHEDQRIEGWLYEHSTGGAAGSTYWMGNSMTDRRPSRNKVCWDADPDYDAAKCSATAQAYFSLYSVQGTTPSCQRQSPPLSCPGTFTVDYDTLACCNKVFGAAWVRGSGAPPSTWSVADVYQPTANVAGYVCATLGRNLTEGSRTFSNYSLSVVKMTGGGSSRTVSRTRSKSISPRFPITTLSTSTTTTVTSTTTTTLLPPPVVTTTSTTTDTTSNVSGVNNSSPSSLLVYTTPAMAPYPSLRERWDTGIAISTFIVYLFSAFFPPLAALAQVVAAAAVLPNQAETILPVNVTVNISAKVVPVYREAEQEAANATTTAMTTTTYATQYFELNQTTLGDDWRSFHVFTKSPLSVVLSPAEFVQSSSSVSASASSVDFAFDRLSTLCAIYLIGVAALLGVLLLIAIVVSGGSKKGRGRTSSSSSSISRSMSAARERNAAVVAVVDDELAEEDQSQSRKRSSSRGRRRAIKKRVRFQSDTEMSSPPRVIDPDGRISRADEFVSDSSNSETDEALEQDMQKMNARRRRRTSSSSSSSFSLFGRNDEDEHPPISLTLASRSMMLPSLLIMWTALFVPPFWFHCGILLSFDASSSNSSSSFGQARAVAIVILLLSVIFIVFVQYVSVALKQELDTTQPALELFKEELEERREKLIQKHHKRAVEGEEHQQQQQQDHNKSNNNDESHVVYPNRGPPSPPSAHKHHQQPSPHGFMSPGGAADASSPRSIGQHPSPSPSASASAAAAAESILVHTIGVLYYRESDEPQQREPTLFFNGFYGTSSSSVAQWFVVFDPFLPKYLGLLSGPLGLAFYLVFASLICLFSGMQLEQRATYQAPLTAVMLVMLILFCVIVAVARPHRRSIYSFAAFLLCALAAAILIVQYVDSTGTTSGSDASRFFGQGHFALVVVAVIAFWLFVVAAIACAVHELQADAGLHEDDFDPIECMRKRGDFDERNEAAAKRELEDQRIWVEEFLMASRKEDVIGGGGGVGGDDNAPSPQKYMLDRPDGAAAAAAGAGAEEGDADGAPRSIAAVGDAAVGGGGDASHSVEREEQPQQQGGGGRRTPLHELTDDAATSLEDLARRHADARREGSSAAAGGGAGSSISPLPEQQQQLQLPSSSRRGRPRNNNNNNNSGLHPNHRIVHVSGNRPLGDDGQFYDYEEGDDEDDESDDGSSFFFAAQPSGALGGGGSALRRLRGGNKNRPIFREQQNRPLADSSGDPRPLPSGEFGDNDDDDVLYDGEEDEEVPFAAQEDRKFHLQVLLLSWFRDFVSQEQREPTVQDIERDAAISGIYHEYAHLRRHLRRERKKWMLRRLNQNGDTAALVAQQVDDQDALEEAARHKAAVRKRQEQHLLKSNTPHGRKLALNLKLNEWRDEFEVRHGRRPTHADVAKDIAAMAMYESYLALKVAEKQQQQQQQQQHNQSSSSAANLLQDADGDEHRIGNLSSVNNSTAATSAAAVSNPNNTSGGVGFDESFTGSFLALQQEQQRHAARSAASGDSLFFGGHDAADMYRFGSPRTRKSLERKEFLRRKLHEWAEEQRKVRLFPRGGVPMESDYLLDPDVGEIYCQYQELKHAIRASKSVEKKKKSGGASDNGATTSAADDDLVHLDSVAGAAGGSSSFETKLVMNESAQGAGDGVSVWRQRRRRLLGREISRWKQEWVARHAADNAGAAPVEPTVSDMNDKMRALYEQYQVLRAAATTPAAAAAAAAVPPPPRQDDANSL